MTSAQVLRQAEALKASVADTSMGSNEAWVSRQALQDIYQKLLVMDLEYALDKKVEQDLWNHAFKNQINSMQTQAKDKQNPKRSEIQSSLNLFLETASGFYLQLLQELCSAFKLDLPFRRKSSKLGILKEYGPLNNKLKMPKKSSSMYICQHCLVHLGDIARYRQQIDQAQTYYRHAAQLVPYNGQPYNQLAILEAAKGNKLSTVFYYIRSIAVKHPFPVASTNLEKFYAKISKEMLDFRGKLSMSEIIGSFLQFHAFIHLCTELEKAKKLVDHLVASLPTHITSMSFSAYQMVQMIAINLFALHHAQRRFPLDGEDDNSINEPLGSDEEKCYDMVFNLTISLFENMLHYTPKQEQKAKEYHTLPALKIILDWLRIDCDLLSKSIFKNSTIWPNLSKLLNNLQFHTNQKDFVFEPQKYLDMPLPEDCDLQCFSPMQKAFMDLDFLKVPSDGLIPELELRLRCHRMVEHGLWISEEFPSLNLMNFQKLKSAKLQFSAPTAQVKVLPGSDGDTTADRKSIRQNVAIQAIMQKKSMKKSIQNESEMSGPETSPGHIQNKVIKEEFGTSDAGIMTHTTMEVQVGGLSQEMPALIPSTMSGVSLRETSPALNQSPHSYLQAFRLGGSQGGLYTEPDVVQGMGMLPFQMSSSGPNVSQGQQYASQIHPGLPQNVISDVNVQLAPGMSTVENSEPQGHFGALSGQLGFQGLGPPPPRPVGSSHTVSPVMPPGHQLGPFTSHSCLGGNHSPKGDHSPTQGFHPGPLSQTFPQTHMPPQLFDSSPFSADSPSPLHLSPSDSPTQTLFGSSPLTQPIEPAQQGGYPLPSSVFNTPPRSSPSPTSGPLGRLFSGSSGQDSAYSPGPWMSCHDDFRETTSDIPIPDMTGLAIKHPDSDLTSGFPASSRMALTFPSLALPESIPKPDSPPIVPGTGSALFPMPGDGGLPLPTTSTYTLFSQSPWSVQINAAADSKGSGMHPGGFDTSEPPLHDPADDIFQDLPERAGFNPLGFTFGSADGSTWASPPSPNQTDTAGNANTLLSSNIQSLWSSGPSPLEKLLEQQKQQRHSDPH